MMDRRQISPQEKAQILESNRREGSVRCFVDNAPIDDDEEIEFHHIRPYSEEGPTEISNIAPVCREHHRRIRTLSLTEFRDWLQLEELFKGGQQRWLDDLLAVRLEKDGFGHRIRYEISEDRGQISLFLAESSPRIFPLQVCPATRLRYFYDVLPAKYIRNDKELQPRPLEAARVWELYRHLLLNTQLAPAVCRLAGNQILLFDGQHKSAAQVWAGRTSIDCKVYLEPDIRSLKETNLIAHDKLRQMPFYTSTLIAKYSDIFREEWQAYIERPGQKAERGFVEFLRGRGKSRAEALKMIRMAMWADILDDPENRLAEFIAEKNRARKNPLTISLVQRTFLTHFLAAPPLDIEFEGPEDKRQEEKGNLVRFMSLIADEMLVGRWNPEANNAAHKLAERLYFAGAVRAWVPMLRDVTAQILGLYDPRWTPKTGQLWTPEIRPVR